jgi:Asp-tRNA(Asn)/Glu-tRNA(Gln) amidotransferase B subunit
MSSPRQTTNRLLDLMDQGVLSAQMVAEMCLQYMSEDDVSDMVQANDLSDLVDEGTEYEPE